MTKAERLLSVLAVCACLGTLLPLLLYFVGAFEMSASFPAVALPCLMVLLVLAVVLRKRKVPVFWSRFAIGAAAGLLATVVYDGVRLAGLLVKFPGFEIIGKFGVLITGAANDTPLTIAVGWFYHFSNGTVFGIIYCLIAGRAPVWVAVAWGLVLEAGMLATYPSAFGVNMGARSPGLFWSVLGHIGYGAALGVLVRRWLPDAREVSRAAS